MQQQHEGIACYVTAKHGISCRLHLLANAMKNDSNIAKTEVDTRRAYLGTLLWWQCSYLLNV